MVHKQNFQRHISSVERFFVDFMANGYFRVKIELKRLKFTLDIGNRNLYKSFCLYFQQRFVLLNFTL